MENSMEVPQKTKNRTNIWSSNPTPGYIDKENENTNSKKYMHSMFIAALFTIPKIWKQRKCPSADEWVKKMWYISMEYYWAIKKQWNSDMCKNMNEPRGHYKSDRERQYCMLLLIFWFKILILYFDLKYK